MEGYVHIQVAAKNGGTGVEIFTLPVGYRPSDYVTSTGVALPNIRRVYVSSGGTVYMDSPANSGIWLSLTFKAEQ